jgi:RimJ/RimL family protein N-acetyltransferase
VELRDEDLALRPWMEDDVAALVAACNDVEITRWIPVIPSPYTEADALAFIHREVSTGPEHSFAITLDQTVIGSIGMSVTVNETGQIGYWCARESRGRGLTPRALRLVCRFGFRELGLGRLELTTDPENLPSQRVAEKVGFGREGVLRSHMLHPDRSRRDSVLFSLLPGELRD